MSILIRAVQRRNPSDKNAPAKWYPVQHTTEQLDETEVAGLIADETTLNPAEALMAIRQLSKVIPAALKNSKSVRLGDWGSFYPTLKTTGADTKEELTAANVKEVNIMFKPSEKLKAEMRKAGFVWVEKIGKNNKAGGGSQGEAGGGDRPEIE